MSENCLAVVMVFFVFFLSWWKHNEEARGKGEVIGPLTSPVPLIRPTPRRQK